MNQQRQRWWEEIFWMSKNSIFTNCSNNWNKVCLTKCEETRPRENMSPCNTSLNRKHPPGGWRQTPSELRPQAWPQLRLSANQDGSQIARQQSDAPSSFLQADVRTLLMNSFTAWWQLPGAQWDRSTGWRTTTSFIHESDVKRASSLEPRSSPASSLITVQWQVGTTESPLDGQAESFNVSQNIWCDFYPLFIESLLTLSFVCWCLSVSPNSLMNNVSPRSCTLSIHSFIIELFPGSRVGVCWCSGPGDLVTWWPGDLVSLLLGTFPPGGSAPRSLICRHGDAAAAADWFVSWSSEMKWRRHPGGRETERTRTETWISGTEENVSWDKEVGTSWKLSWAFTQRHG